METFGQDLVFEVDSLKSKHKLISSTSRTVVQLESAVFKTQPENFNLIFNEDSIDEINKKMDAIVKVCDESFISRDNYRQLTQVIPEMERQYKIEQHRIKITNQINLSMPITNFSINELDLDNVNEEESYSSANEIVNNNAELLINNSGVGAYRSITSILKYLMPTLKSSNPPMLNQNDIIFIKIGADGRRVGRRQNHVIFTFCILNEKNNVLSPKHQYT
jgi:hypothetical protein